MRPPQPLHSCSCRRRRLEHAKSTQWSLVSITTMRKFQDFSVIRILREINIGKTRSSKTAVFAIFVSLNFANLENFSLQEVQEFVRIKIKPLKALKWQILHF